MRAPLKVCANFESALGILFLHGNSDYGGHVRSHRVFSPDISTDITLVQKWNHVGVPTFHMQSFQGFEGFFCTGTVNSFVHVV